MTNDREKRRYIKLLVIFSVIISLGMIAWGYFESGEIAPYEVARRDTLTKESMQLEGVEATINALMDEIQANIYQKALDFRAANTIQVDTWEEFKQKIEEGGFLLCHWDGTPETEEKIKEETKATIRCIPLDTNVIMEEGKCIYSGKPSKQRVIFARSY